MVDLVHITPQFRRFTVGKDKIGTVTGKILVEIPAGGAFHGALLRRVRKFGFGDVDAVVRTIGAVGSEVSVTLDEAAHNENKVNQVFAEAGAGGMSVVLDLNVPTQPGFEQLTDVSTAAVMEANKRTANINVFVGPVVAGENLEAGTYSNWKVVCDIAPNLSATGFTYVIHKGGGGASLNAPAPVEVGDIEFFPGPFTIDGSDVNGDTNRHSIWRQGGALTTGQWTWTYDKHVPVPSISNDLGALYIDVHFDA